MMRPHGCRSSGGPSPPDRDAAPSSRLSLSTATHLPNPVATSGSTSADEASEPATPIINPALQGFSVASIRRSLENAAAAGSSADGGINLPLTGLGREPSLPNITEGQQLDLSADEGGAGESSGLRSLPQSESLLQERPSEDQSGARSVHFADEVVSPMKSFCRWSSCCKPVLACTL